MTVLYVVEKGEGVPDKTPVEQSEQVAAEAFDVFRGTFPDAETDITYRRDVVEGIIEVADEVELLVETGDVEVAIGNAATGRTLVIVGATERGLLSRIVGGPLTLSVLDDLDTTVLLAERPNTRSVRERLFG